MQPVLAYLLKMILCSGILLGYYWVALRNERFHRWNRFYLLGSMLLSISVPFLNIQVVAPEEPSSVVYMVSELPWNKANAAPAFNWSWKHMVNLAAVLVSILLLVHLLVSVLKVFRLYRKQPAKQLNEVSLFITEEEYAPFSFFKWLFWRKDIDPESPHGKRMLQHELTHIAEKHSADKLFTELLLVVFWMNPLFWIMRRELYAIHEFLADQKAIARNDGAAFASMILAAAHTTIAPTLSNPFFTSQLKRRLLMITTSKSNSYSYLRRISGLVLMLFTTTVLVLTIEQAQAQKKTPPPPPPVPAAPSQGPATELPDSIKSTKVIERNGVSYIHYEMMDGRKLVYDLKQAKEKNYFIPPPPPPPLAPPPPPAKKSSSASRATEPVKPASTVAPVAIPQTPVPAKAATTATPEAVPAPPPPPARGQALTIETNGEKPVYFLNGVQITEAQMNQLDPNTIERVDVLKGDQATGTYGETGKNGVVNISTKGHYQTVEDKKSVQTVQVIPDNASAKTAVKINSVTAVNVNANANVSPVYVVNKQKVSVDVVNKIQADAIVNVNVIKEEAAVKKYGNEGKNGVVEITTKKPVNGKQ